MGEVNLVDYTKFRLKPAEEIREVFKGVGKIFILYCRKCYKKFEEDRVEEFDELLDILGEDSQKIVGSLGVDFLCNDFLSKKKISSLDLSICDSVGVISCGLGVQFVAQTLEGELVYTLADSLPQSGNSTSEVGYHGISLEKEKCCGCSQCYLNLTGGICPLINCPKGLLNGPCGGAKNGKCEVNPDLDCAWEKIYERVKKQGRKLILESPQIRDYSKPPLKLQKDLSLQNQTFRDESFYGGFHPLEKKEETEEKRVESFPEPKIVTIFLSQHTGKKAKPLVKPGDKIRVGQKIGEADGFISSPVHSSISGKVISLKEEIHPLSLKKDLAVTVENDGENKFDSSIKPGKDFENLPKDGLLKMIREKGIVGLGGAMFPTYVKLSPPKPIDTLIINGCECEPYLNSDNRMMIEHPKEIFTGISIVEKILGVKKIFIGVEDNKLEALTILKSSPHKSSSVEVASLKTKYPQGAEKMLIKRITGREVPEKGLPLDVGVIVLNVATVFAIYEAIMKGIPLIQRVVTVSGDGAIKPGNYLMKMGTPFKEIVEYSFGNKGEELFKEYELKMGGPLMGTSQLSLNSGIIKGTTGLTLLRKFPVEASEERECIRCGRCVEVCPMELYPLYYAFYGKRGEWEKGIEYQVENCIECGCCEFICSSKISLLGFIKKEKEYAHNSNKA
ncbi:MAG: electron transport complex subunit RsxC [Candidatus Aerophobetes bacterium]|nr:electron transport complex subunit RsxC [Candidatus Aerophobetes bacterium]